jgi:hypothetical protein
MLPAQPDTCFPLDSTPDEGDVVVVDYLASGLLFLVCLVYTPVDLQCSSVMFVHQYHMHRPASIYTSVCHFVVASARPRTL